MWRRKNQLALVVCLFSAVFILPGGLNTPASAEQKEPITVGLMYDMTGPTQLGGIPIGGAFRDYVNLTNKKGGIDGHPIKAIEHEMGYKVDLAVEAYERFKAAGAVYYPAWGTPIIYALTERTTQDKIPTATPGFGRADAADGKRFPYITGITPLEENLSLSWRSCRKSWATSLSPGASLPPGSSRAPRFWTSQKDTRQTGSYCTTGANRLQYQLKNSSATAFPWSVYWVSSGPARSMTSQGPDLIYPKNTSA